MNFSDEKYQSLRDKVQELISDGNEWNEIETLDVIPTDMEGVTSEIYFKVMLIGAKLSEIEFSMENWKELVAFERERSKIKHLGKLERRTRNNAVASTAISSQWYCYREQLKNNGFSVESIEAIQYSCQEILQQLDSNTLNEPVKGLVVGDVQSGKTANMAGLISMASDYGFNYFIILSGTIESLRKQTEDRMFDDLKTPAKKFIWNRMENPSVEKASSVREMRWENIHLEGNNRYFTVCLKQVDRLNNLLNWLYLDGNKTNKLKVLIIDDEADQASINTNDKLENKTAINQAILNIVHGINEKKLLASNYISYTATPYANLLSTGEKESLYPSDFIFQLYSSSDYIGVKKMFGLEDPQREVDINYVRDIPKNEIADIYKIHKEGALQLPESLERAIDWFFVSSAALRALNLRKPLSMLIHTSHLKQHHSNINYAVQAYIQSMIVNMPKYIDKLEILYSSERAELPHKSFVDGMPNYSAVDKIQNYPEWSEVKPQIEKVLRNEKLFSYTKLDEDNIPEFNFRGFQIAVDNSDSTISRSDDETVRLAYPEDDVPLDFAPMFIVIGGNTLSRGLTLKGLTTTYFCRQTNLGDSLMQMGRWFGYRKGYELFPRVWLNGLTIERFSFLAQLNEELAKELDDMESRGHTPDKWAPRLRNTPSLQFLQLTAANKRRGEQKVELDFTGEAWQTTIFDKDMKIQNKNLRITEDFLSSLNNMDDRFSKKSRLVWRDISFSNVDEFLSKFHFNDRTKFSHVSALLEWYQETIGESGYKNWTVMVSSKGKISKSEKSSNLKVNGYDIPSVYRSYRTEDESSYSIGILRTPVDQIFDIKELTEDDIKNFEPTNVNKIRKKYSYDKVPQLVIYKIDGENKFNGKKPMDIGTDVVGIYLKLPGIRKSSQLARYVNVNIPESTEDIEGSENE